MKCRIAATILIALALLSSGCKLFQEEEPPHGIKGNVGNGP